MSYGYLNIESNDGQCRYKIGIIDLLTKYDIKKKGENIFKSVIHNVDSTSISAIDQDTYQNRFMNYMNE